MIDHIRDIGEAFWEVSFNCATKEVCFHKVRHLLECVWVRREVDRVRVEYVQCHVPGCIVSTRDRVAGDDERVSSPPINVIAKPPS